MTSIHSIPQVLTETLDTIKNSSQSIGEWMGRAIQWLKHISQERQNQSHVAFTVFITANVIFFILINSFANALDERVHSSPQKLNVGEKRFNTILIDGAVVGGFVLVFNVLLFKLTHYPLSKIFLAALTVTAIACRAFLHPRAENKEISIPGPGRDQEDSIEVENEEIEKKDSSTQQIEASKTKKIKCSKAQRKFITDFCEEIRLALKETFQYVNFSHEQKEAQSLFLDKLKNGIATIEDQADKCCATHVSVQAMFEKMLCTMLSSGEITQAQVLFLTNLPCTPLRTPQQEIDKNKEAKWNQWTVDIRTQTVRNLRETGATVLVSYCAADYQALHEQSRKDRAEFDTYEVEKMKSNTLDLPLSTAIPKELIGALYLFSDNEGNRYILASQRIQIQYHTEAPKECWKMWFGAEGNPEVEARAQEMMRFVQKDKPEINLF